MLKFIGAGAGVALLVVLLAWGTGQYDVIEWGNGYIGLFLIFGSSVFSYFMSSFFSKRGDLDDPGKPKRPRWYWPLGLFLMALPPLVVALIYSVLT